MRHHLAGDGPLQAGPLGIGSRDEPPPRLLQLARPPVQLGHLVGQVGREPRVAEGDPGLLAEVAQQAGVVLPQGPAGGHLDGDDAQSFAAVEHRNLGPATGDHGRCPLVRLDDRPPDDLVGAAGDVQAHRDRRGVDRGARRVRDGWQQAGRVGAVAEPAGEVGERLVGRRCRAEGQPVGEPHDPPAQRLEGHRHHSRGEQRRPEAVRPAPGGRTEDDDGEDVAARDQPAGDRQQQCPADDDVQVEEPVAQHGHRRADREEEVGDVERHVVGVGVIDPARREEERDGEAESDRRGGRGHPAQLLALHARRPVQTTDESDAGGHQRHRREQDPDDPQDEGERPVLVLRVEPHVHRRHREHPCGVDSQTGQRDGDDPPPSTGREAAVRGDQEDQGQRRHGARRPGQDREPPDEAAEGDAAGSAVVGGPQAVGLGRQGQCRDGATRAEQPADRVPGVARDDQRAHHDAAGRREHHRGPGVLGEVLGRDERPVLRRDDSVRDGQQDRQDHERPRDSRPGHDPAHGAAPTVATTVVPRPGTDVRLTEPPTASRRSRMLDRPAPVRICSACSASKPAPSSATVSRRSPPSRLRRTLMPPARACFAAFCTASIAKK